MKRKTKKFTFFSLIFAQKYLFLLALLLIFISEGAIHIFQFVKGAMVELAMGNSNALRTELFKFVALVLIIPISFYLYSKVYLRISALCVKI